MNTQTYYEVIEEDLCMEDGGQYTAYGIRATGPDGDRTIRDISTDRIKMCSFADRLNTLALDAGHLDDAIEDFLTEESLVK